MVNMIPGGGADGGLGRVSRAFLVSVADTAGDARFWEGVSHPGKRKMKEKRRKSPNDHPAFLFNLKRLSIDLTPG
jgi:hypothetical protein